jgi:hypothetical protein
MTKLIPIFIDGKKWIQLSQLSSEQSRLIKSWLPISSLRKVLFQGMELTDCLDFETYDFWFRTNQVKNDKQALLDF